MKKTISTILALTMLTTPLLGSTCFAKGAKDNAKPYVQEQKDNEQYKSGRSTLSNLVKTAGCVAAGAVTVTGVAVGGILAGAAAGYKCCEDLIPEQVKQWLPSL